METSRVVVPRQQRIELVIVASRAGERDPENALRERIHLLVVHVEQQLLLVLLRQRLLTERQKARRDQAAAVDRARLVGRKQVARNLLAHEAVERDILS